LKQDFVSGVRQLRASPMTSAVVIASLSAAIGIITAVVRLADAAFVRDLAVDRSERLISINVTRADGSTTEEVSYPVYRIYRRESRALRSVAARASKRLWVDGGAGVETVDAEIVSSNYFATLGLR